MTETEIDNIFSDTKEEIQFHLLLKELEEYNNNFDYPFNLEKELIDFKDELTSNNFEERKLAAKELLENKRLSKLEEELIKYSNSLEHNYGINKDIEEIINDLLEELTFDNYDKLLKNGKNLIYEDHLNKFILDKQNELRDFSDNLNEKSLITTAIIENGLDSLEEYNSFVMVDYTFNNIIDNVIANIIKEKQSKLTENLEKYINESFDGYNTNYDELLNELNELINEDNYNEIDLVNNLTNEGKNLLNELFLDEVKDELLNDLINYHNDTYLNEELDEVLSNLLESSVNLINKNNVSNKEDVLKQFNKAKNMIDDYYNEAVIYVNATSGLNNTQTNRGNYNLPYRTIEYAVSSAPSKVTILLQTNITLSAVVNITKDIKIKSSDIDINGNKLNTRFSIIRNVNYGISTNSNVKTNDNHMFEVSASSASRHGKLTLENIRISGNGTRTRMHKGVSIRVLGSANYRAALTILEDTLITASHSYTSGYGGSAILLSGYADFSMYGGEITGNYHKTKTSAIGGGASTNSYVLMSGRVYNNYSPSRTLLITQNNIIGGDFTIEDNFEYTNTSKPRNFQVGSTINLEEGFHGRVLVSQEGAKRYDRVNISYDGEVGGLAPYTIVLEHDNDLYAVYDYDKGYYVWDYKYTEFVKIKKPTLINKGTKEKYAYEGGKFDPKTSPSITKDIEILHPDNFDITIDTNYRTITFDDGEFKFEYTLDDFKEMVYDYYVDYHNLYGKDIPEDLKELINEEVLKIRLNDESYETVLDKFKSGEEMIDIYYEKKQAKEDLEEFYNSLDEKEKELVEDIINDAKNTIDESDKREYINPSKESGINDAIDEILKNAREELTEHLENYHNTKYTNEDLENVRFIINEKVDSLTIKNYKTIMDELKESGEEEIDLFYAKLKFKEDMIHYYENDLANEDISKEALNIIENQLDNLNLNNIEEIENTTKELLDEYFYLKSDKDYVERIIREYHIEKYSDEFPIEIDNEIFNIVKGIDKKLTIEELALLVNKGKDFIDNFYKTNDLLNDLENIYNSLDKNSKEKVSDKYEEIKDNLINETNNDELDNIFNNGIEEIKDLLISDVKNDLKERLESYNDSFYPDTAEDKRPKDINELIETQVSKVNFDNFNNLEFIENLETEGYVLIDIYYAKEKLEEEVLTFIKDELNEETNPLDLNVENYLNEKIDSINEDNVYELEQIIEDTKNEINLYYERLKVKEDLENKLNNLKANTYYGGDLDIIVEEYLLEKINEVDTVNLEELEEFKNNTLTLTDTLVYESIKDRLEENLNLYHNDKYENYDINDVLNIILKAKEDVTIENYLNKENINNLYNEAILDIDTFYSKVKLEEELIDFVENVLNEDLTKESLEIINEYVKNVDGSNYDTSYNEAIIDLENYYNIKSFKDDVEKALKDYHTEEYSSEIPEDVLDIIYEFVKEIDGKVTTEELKDKINDGKNLIDHFYAKEKFKEDMNKYYKEESGFNEVPTEVIDIINEQNDKLTLEIFNNENDFESLEIETKDLIDKYLELKDKKDALEEALKEHHTSLDRDELPNDLNEYIKNIVKSIDENTSEEDLLNLEEEGKSYINKYYANKDAINKLEELYNSLTDDNKEIINNIYNEGLDELENLYNDKNKTDQDINEKIDEITKNIKDTIIANKKDLLKDSLEEYHDNVYLEGTRPEDINELINDALNEIDFENANNDQSYEKLYNNYVDEIDLYYIRLTFKEDMINFIDQELLEEIDPLDQGALSIIEFREETINKETLENLADIENETKDDLILYFAKKNEKSLLEDFKEALENFESIIDQIDEVTMDLLDTFINDIDELELNELNDYALTKIDEINDLILKQVKNKAKDKLKEYHAEKYELADPDEINSLIDEITN